MKIYATFLDCDIITVVVGRRPGLAGITLRNMNMIGANGRHTAPPSWHIHYLDVPFCIPCSFVLFFYINVFMPKGYSGVIALIFDFCI